MNSNLYEPIVKLLVKAVILKIRLNSFLIVMLSLFIYYSSDSLAHTDTTRVDSVDISVNVGLMSRYIWRGQNYGQAPSIQPGIELGWKNFILGAWGAYKFTGVGEQETDFYLSKTIGPVTISVWDYWTFSDTSEMDFFDYSEETTGHLLEAQLLLSGGETLPFNLLGGWFIYGSDSTQSLYLEVQYLFTKGTTEFTAFAGYQAKGSFYASYPSFVNIGCMVSKPIPVTERWELPLCISLIANPYEKSVYIVAGITF